MKNVLISVILTALLVGCGTTGPVVAPNGKSPSGELTSPASDKPIDKPKDKVEIDAYLLEDCAGFKQMTFANPTPNDVLAQRASDVAVLRECAQRHRSLSKIVKDAFNLK